MTFKTTHFKGFGGGIQVFTC